MSAAVIAENLKSECNVTYTNVKFSAVYTCFSAPEDLCSRCLSAMASVLERPVDYATIITPEGRATVQ